MSIWPVIAGGVLGGVANYFSTKETNEANAARNAENNALQREFAQHGIRWRVADAQAAGIHPLAALGAQTTSFAPSMIGDVPNTSIGDAMSGMGQDVSRAISATRTQEERDLATLQVQSARLDLEGRALDNQIKASQLRRLNGVGGAMPGSETFIDGQGNSAPKGLIQTKPMERTASLPGAPHSEPGAITDVGYSITPTGLVPVPSNDVKQRIEDSMPHEWTHFLRNNFFPDSEPPKEALGRWKGAVGWKWNPLKMEWQPRYRSDPKSDPNPGLRPTHDDKAWKVRKSYKEGA